MVRSIAYFNALFITGYVPTQQDYVDYADTMTNLPVILAASGNTGGFALKSPDGTSFLVTIGNSNINIVKGDSSVQVLVGSDRIILKASNFVQIQSDLNILSLAGSTKRYLSVDEGGSVIASEVKPKIYEASISQTGTSAPSVTGLDVGNNPNPFMNDIGAIDFSYNDVGDFLITSAGLFTLGKTTIELGLSGGVTMLLDVLTDSAINIGSFVRALDVLTGKNTLVQANDVLVDTKVTITVWP